MAGRFNLAEHIQAAQPSAPRDIEIITGEIIQLKQEAGNAILGIGQRLIEAKEMLSHGEWLPWLTERVEFSEKSAQNFMRIARNYSNPQALADLGATKALMLLAIPAESREEFISAPHLVSGEEKTVIDMTSRELEAAIKERDAALKAAEQAKADRSAAELAREQMAQDITFANERIAGLSAEVEQKTAEARERVEETARLEKELAELRARPVEVAVEVDSAAVKAARKEAESAMQAKLDRAKKAQAKAEADKKTAEDAKAKAQQELEQAKAKAQQELGQAKAEARLILERAERAEKKAAIAGNEDLVLFRTLFDQVQEQVNKLGGVLMKVHNKDPEKAGGLKNALLALADRIKGVAEG